MKQLSSITKIIVLVALLVGVLGGVLFVNERYQPRIDGQTMGWWLNEWVTRSNAIFNTTMRINGPAENEGKSQPDILNAFYRFGKPGVEFLIAHAYQKPRLNPIKWNFRRWLARVTKYPKIGEIPPSIDGAQRLLMEMEKPFEWVEPHLMLGSDKSERVYFSLNLLCGVTNRHDEMVHQLKPLLESTHSGIRGKALLALWRIRDHADPVAEVLVRNPDDFNKFPQYVPVLESIAPHSEAAADILKEISMSEDWDQAFEVSLALLSSPYGVEHGFRRAIDLLISVTDPFASAPPFFRRHYSMNTPLDRIFHKLENSTVNFTPISDDLNTLLGQVDDQNKITVAGLMITHGIKDEAIESLVYSTLNAPSRIKGLDEPAKEAMRWLLIRDPEDPRVWKWYTRLVDSPESLDSEHYLNYLNILSKPSKSAKELLERIRHSKSHPNREKAAKLLDELSNKGLLLD